MAFYRFAVAPGSRAAPLVVGVAVFSHWVLDLLVHRPDLPLYDDSAKVGLGLWDRPVPAFGLEMLLLFGGMWLYFRTGVTRRLTTAVFGVIMVAIQACGFWGPPPVSDTAAATTALAAYVLFAAIVRFLEQAPGARNAEVAWHALEAAIALAFLRKLLGRALRGGRVACSLGAIR